VSTTEPEQRGICQHCGMWAYWDGSRWRHKLSHTAACPSGRTTANVDTAQPPVAPFCCNPGEQPDFHDSVCTGPGVPEGFTCSHPSHRPLLNGAHTPDVDHTRGAAEALALVRQQVTAWHELNPLLDGRPAVATVLGILRNVAAEMGIDTREGREEREARRKPTDCPRCGADAPIGAYAVCEPCAVAEGWTMAS